MKEGDVFQHRFVVTERIYRGFIDLFQDQNPLHVDSDYAGQKGFKGRVMHGNILNGFLSYGIGECLPIKNVMIYSQSIQYLKPVYLGDSFLWRAKLVHISESVRLFEFDYSFEREEGGEKIAKGKIQIGVLP